MAKPSAAAFLDAEDEKPSASAFLDREDSHPFAAAFLDAPDIPEATPDEATQATDIANSALNAVAGPGSLAQANAIRDASMIDDARQGEQIGLDALEVVAGPGSLANANRIMDAANQPPPAPVAPPPPKGFLEGLANGLTFGGTIDPSGALEMIKLAAPAAGIGAIGSDRNARITPEQEAAMNRGARTPIVTFGKPTGNTPIEHYLSHVIQGVEGFSTPENLAMMAALGGAPALIQKAVGAAFLAQMIKKTPEIGMDIYNADTPQEKAALAGDLTVNTGLAALLGTHLGGRAPMKAAVRAASMDIAADRVAEEAAARVANEPHIKKMLEYAPTEALEQAAADPAFRASAPYNSALIDAEIASRKATETGEQPASTEPSAPAEAPPSTVEPANSNALEPFKTGDRVTVNGKPGTIVASPGEVAPNGAAMSNGAYEVRQDEGGASTYRAEDLKPSAETGETGAPQSTAEPAAPPAESYKGGPGAMGPVEAEAMTAEQQRVSIANEPVNARRAVEGNLKLMDEERQSNPETWAKAEKLIEENRDYGSDIVDKIRSGEKQSVTHVEEAALIHEAITVKNLRDLSAVRAADENATHSERAAANEDWQKYENRLNEIDQATKLAGTSAGRALQIRKMQINDDFTYAGIERAARAAKGRALNPEEAAKIKAQAAKIAEQEAEIERLKKEGGTKQRTATSDTANEEVRKNVEKSERANKASGKKVDVEKQRKNIVDGMKKRVADGDTANDLYAYVQKLSENFHREAIQKGEKITRDEITDKIHKVLTDEIGLKLPREFTGREGEANTQDLISGIGRATELTTDPVKLAKMETREQLQKVGKINRFLQRMAAPKTGPARKATSAEVRALEKQGRELAKQMGVEVTDPAKQLATALAAKKTRLRNEIADIDRSISLKEPMVQNTGVPIGDAETAALEAARDAKRAEYDELFPKRDLTDAERAAIYSKSLDRSIAKLEEDLKAGKIYADKAKPAPTSAEIEAKRGRLEALRAERDELRNLDTARVEALREKALIDAIERAQKATPPPREGTPTVDTAKVADLKAKLEEVREARKQSPEVQQAKIKAAMEVAEKAIAELNRRLSDGDTSKSPSKTPLSAPELDALREQRAALEDAYREMVNAKKPRISPEELALQRAKTSAMSRNAALLEKIANNDFGPKPAKSAIVPDAELRYHQRINAQLKDVVRQERMKDERARRGWGERVSGTLANLNRVNVLGHISVLEHLAGAALENVATRPVGTALAQLFRFNKTLEAIRKKAVYEGGITGKSERANVAGLAKSWGALLDKLKHGKSELDWLHDKKSYPKEFLEIVSNVHGAIKEPIRQGIYGRSLELRIKAAEEMGLDPTHDTVLREVLSKEAYDDSNMDIFMGDNFLTKALHNNVTAYLRGLKGDPALARFTADVLDILFPVVNVSTNIAIRKFRLAAGLPEAAIRIGRAASRGELADGAKTLSARDAELITRSFKYGLFGVALGVYAWNHADQFGGLVVPGQNAPRDKNSTLKPGDIALPGGSHLSHHFAHGPVGGHMNLLADARRIYNAEVKGHPENKWSAVGDAAFFSMFASAKDLPMFSTGARLLSPFKTGGQKTGELLRNMFEFGAAQDVAAKMDSDASGTPIPRKTSGLIDELKLGIPRLRETLPKKKSKR